MYAEKHGDSYEEETIQPEEAHLQNIEDGRPKKSCHRVWFGVIMDDRNVCKGV